MSKVLLVITSVLFSTSAIADQKSALNRLGEAIGRGDETMFNESLSQVTDVDQFLNPQRETPFTLAAYNDRHEWVVTLLHRGAKLDHQTTAGYTALMFAAMAMSNADDALKTVRVLLAAGANRALRNRDGKTALDLAMERKQTKIAEVLRGSSR